MKLQGGTLIYALAISLLMGMITASVLINEQYNRLLIQRDVVREEIVRNANSGINYLCAQTAMNADLDYDLFARGKDSVRLQCKPWGVYDVLISTAHSGSETFERIALAGSVEDSASQYALWLGDMDRPLKICGKTELRGTCFLPRAGVERTYIEGSSYSGRELVYGPIVPSARFVPEYNKERVAVLNELLKGEAQPADSLVTWTQLSEQDSVFCSFAGAVCRVEEKLPLIISSVYLEGQIVIRSSVSILLKNSATLINVILVAPEIKIEEGSIGQFQAIARDSIIPGKKTVLQFPSALCLCADEFSPLQTGITIKEECEISGTIFAVQQSTQIQRKMHIAVAKDCTINGSIYTNHTLDLKGEVNGSVTCQKLMLSTNSAQYENTLLDATINNATKHALPGGGVLSDMKRKEVISWLF